MQRELAQHVGGAPSITERLLIDRAAWMTLHIAGMDAKALETGGMVPHASREYLAWSNTLRQTLVSLGLNSAKTAPVSLQT